MLKLTLAHAGHRSKVELNGEDISRFITAVTVRTAVGDVTTATLEYTGAVIAEVEGVLVLQQAKHFVECSECHKPFSGEEHEPKVITTTAFGATNVTKEIVP